QVDTGNTGRVLASDAAAFLKKSGLPDLILGKISDLADTDNGLEVSLNTELPWAFKSEDKAKYDVIFDSLSPVDGFLSGDKVNPVLLNSKLPVEILGRVWELSDIDHDGKLDRDELAVAMFLVYSVLEKEPVPMALLPALLPPSKRKTWVVSPAEKAHEIFLKTGLPSTLLAHIWALCDTKNCGKLSKDQFLVKGIDPPHILNPEMIPPSDRTSLQKNLIGSSPVADFSAIKELDTLNNEIVDLQREKNNVEQDLKEKEDIIKQRTSEVQDLQDEVQRENINLQKLQNNLESNPIHQESPARSSPEISPDVIDENEVVTASVNEKVCPEFDNEKHAKEEDPFKSESSSLTGPVADTNSDFFQSDPFVGSDPFKDDPFGKIDPFGGDPFKGSDPFASDSFFKQSSTDPFATLSNDAFSASSQSNNTSVETLKHNDPFAPGGTIVIAASDSAPDPFASVFGNESFEDGFADCSTLSKANNEDPFNSATSSSVNNVVTPKNVFDETSIKSEDVPPALPPKTGTPTRPCPPSPGKRPINKLDSSDPFKVNDPFQPFPGNNSPKEKDPDMYWDPFTSSSTCTTNKEGDLSNFANFSAYPSEEDMIEWAKRESEREEEQRLARLNQQEQEDLELAIALSKSEISEA
uniref:Epidermal growth factor receptor substrate 15-like n=1 Tax=Ictidomys tridecemlineatus TaxID=43179 RepID=A0A287DAM7_ICTTR